MKNKLAVAAVVMLSRSQIMAADDGSSRPLSKSCLIMAARTSIKDMPHSFRCELQQDDLEMDQYKNKMKRMEGLPEGWLEANQKSLFTLGTAIHSPNAIIKGRVIDFGGEAATISVVEDIKKERELRHREKQERRHRLKMQDDHTFEVGIVRVEARDTSVDITEQELSDGYFGTHGDNRTMNSFVLECSLGQEKLVRYGANGFTDGVTTYSTSFNILPMDLMDFALDMFEYYVPGGPNTISAEAIVFCMPENTILSGVATWVGVITRGVDGEFTMLQESFCNAVQIQAVIYARKRNMDSTGDATEIVGSILEDYKLCFNAPNTAQVGWYDDYTATVPEKIWELPFEVELIGMGDLGSASDGDVAIAEYNLNEFGVFKLFAQLNVKSGLTQDMFVDPFFAGFDNTPIVSFVSSSQHFAVGGILNSFPVFLKAGEYGFDTDIGFRVMSIDASSKPAKATVRFFHCGPVCNMVQPMWIDVFDQLCMFTGFLCFV